jgi:hypothetical protein
MRLEILSSAVAVNASTRRHGCIAGFLLVLCCMVARAADTAPGLPGTDIALIHALAPEVEALVERTKPASWVARYACLYYALAGRRLLAQHGIAAKLVTGAVIYDPRTPRRHSIRPHAWLETGSYLIDYATLPRLGVVKVIPLDRAVRRARDVRPGITRVLAPQRPRDPDHLRYLARHSARFEQSARGTR